MNASPAIEPPKVPQPRVVRKKSYFLTKSQQDAVTKLGHHFEVFLRAKGARYGGIIPRCKPLLLGSTGTGKTSVARHFAKEKGWSFLSIDCSAFIPEGSTKPGTLLFLRNHVRSHDQGVILWDELCKLLPTGAAALDSNWSTSCFGEILCALDIDERLLGHGWTQADLEKYRTKFFIIGSGAFQFFIKAARQKARGGSVGFGGGEGKPQDFAAFLDQSDAIPPEISTRFAAPAIYVDNPTPEDYERVINQIHEETGLPMQRPMKNLIAEASDAIGGMRWAENYVSDLLFNHPEAGKQTQEAAGGERHRCSDELLTGGERTAKYDFFAPDSTHHVRELNSDVFALHRTLAKMVSSIALATADGRLTQPAEDLIRTYLTEPEPLLEQVFRSLPGCTICADVSPELTDNLMFQNLTMKVWTGIRDISPELHRCGLLDQWHEAFDLLNRVCQRRYNLSIAAANGRYRT